MRCGRTWQFSARPMSDGVLNLDKPQGHTSHDVVERVRELTGVRRVGHAGTLDPLATGVLLVCVGRAATRIAQFLMGARKTYRTQARLGTTTDTFDAEGEIIAQAPVDVARDEIEAALEPYRGRIEQVPPMYSAVKHKGKPLYRLARRGIKVERAARSVEIFSLTLVDWTPPLCTLEMTCSAGTYVRVLVHDLGQRLGCGAHVTGLIRLASGGFHVRDAVPLDQFARKAAQSRWSDLILPVDEALADRFPPLRVPAHAARRLCSGQAIQGDAPEDGVWARVYGPGNRFLALAAYDADAGVWRPQKVFASPDAELGCEDCSQS